MQVSIVIVNYNGKELVNLLISSLKKSTFKSYELIIVDNNSSDGSLEFFKKNYKNIKIVINRKNLGYSGINSAIKHCKGKYILFLNNDMEVGKDCIAKLIKNIELDKNVAMVAPRLINFYDKSLKSNGTWVSRAFYTGHIKNNVNNAIKEIPYLGVGLIRKDFVDMFGYLFDPDYFIYAEDLDLGLRIRLNGKRVMFEPNAIMYHMHAVTTQQSNNAFTTYLMERNLLTTFFKIFSFRNIILFLPYVLFSRFIAIIKDVISFKVNIAFARLRALFFVMINMNLIMKKRYETQKLRKADDNFILKVFSEKYILKKPVLI